MLEMEKIKQLFYKQIFINIKGSHKKCPHKSCPHKDKEQMSELGWSNVLKTPQYIRFMESGKGICLM